MMPSLQYESTWQWEMIPSLSYESTKNMLSDDTPIAFLPKKAMGHDGIIAM